MESILKQCLPYTETKEKKFSLGKIVFTDDSESSEVTIVVKDGECSSVSHSTKLGSDIQSKPVKFVQSRLSESSKPLLVSVPNSLRRLRLTLTAHDDQKVKNETITLLKRYSCITDPAAEVDLMSKGIFENALLDTSKFDLSKIIGEDSLSGPDLIIEDHLDNPLLSDDILNIILRTEGGEGNDPSYSFGFSVWFEEGLEEIPKSSTDFVDYVEEKPSKSLKISNFQKAFGINLEDGPEFRRLLQRYETNIPLLKKTLTAFVEETKNLDLYSRRLFQSQSKIAKHIKSISELQFNDLLKQFGFPKQFERQFTSMFQDFYTNIRFFIRRICDEKILSKIISIFNNNINIENNPINELQIKKRHFENVSKEYYHWMNKYLSKEKERPESKLLSKRKAFELAKFDYLNHFNMLTNNQYYNQFLETLFKFVGLRYSEERPGLLDFKVYDNVKQSQSLLNTNYRIYLNVLLRYNGEKYQFRQMIEACQSNEELLLSLQHNSLNNTTITDDTKTDNLTISNENLDLVFDSNKTTISNGESSSMGDQLSEMAGILYKLGGQKKQGWHKQWVALKDGQLFEYSDWREAKSLIGTPIEIALASVKPTTFEKRHNCLEILTSSGEKHIFQAMDEKDLNRWLKALFNAGQLVDRSRLEESLSIHNKARTRKPESADKRKFLGLLTTDHTTKPPTITDGSLGRSNSPISISSKLKLQDKDILGIVRKIENSDNHLCVDCGAAETVEWISVNFLVCLCIKCSSSHRNLGSHISKIKSLKLDNFSDETELLIHYINNSRVNEYLEANLKDSERVGADASDDQRLEFIRNKYLSKRYCAKYTDINTLLIRAVQSIQIHDALKYIACGANVNVNIQIVDAETQDPVIITLYEYSLKKFIEVEDEGGRKKKLFAISELLILNGCKIDYDRNVTNNIKLSGDALGYWNVKRMKITGSLVSP